VSEYARSKEGESYHYTQNARLKQEREDLAYNFRSLEARAAAERELKERQL